MQTPAPISRATGGPERSSADLLFYDGTCGLCHRWVLFVLRRDPGGARFRFAPIGGVAWGEAMRGMPGTALPDSLVLRTRDGRTLVRSDAVLHIGERLGAGWRTLARLISLLPRWLLDSGYDLVARVRRRLFRRPPDSCPLVPADLRGRFLE